MPQISQSTAVSKATCTRLALAACAGLTVAAAIAPARADYLPLLNASFESQVAPQVDPYVTTNVDSWQKNPQPGYFDPGTFGLQWDQTAGLFANTPDGYPNHIDNMDLNQGAYLLLFPSSGMSQDYNSTDWNHSSPLHAYTGSYQVGKSYSFTLGVIGGGGGMAEGTTLQLALYYLDPSGAPITLNTSNIIYTAVGFQGTNHFVDFEVDVAEVQATDAWAGAPLGVSITNVAGPGAGYWDIDNARVVPEPVSAGLLALGGLLLVSRRRSLVHAGQAVG